MGSVYANEIIEQLGVMDYRCVAIQSLMNLTSEGYVLNRTKQRKK